MQKLGPYIQSHLPPISHNNNQTKSLPRRFAELMAEGKIRAATHLLDNCGDDRAGVPLGPNDILETSEGSCTVWDALIKKHPPAQPCEPSTLLPPTNETLPFHPVLFDSINATAIHTAALKTKGSHGPSVWMLQHGVTCAARSKGPSNELCRAVVKVAVRLAIYSGPLDPHPIQAFTASRLVALNKCPGVRSIGVGEVSRRTMGKAILSVISEDIQQVASTYQLCAGQKGGCEAAVHAMRNFLERDDTEGLLFVDATNAFNTLNREAALRNIHGGPVSITSQCCPKHVQTSTQSTYQR